MKQPILKRFTFIFAFISYSWLGISQECGFGANFQSLLEQNPNLLNELAYSGGNINNLVLRDFIWVSS
jgi:hypothetical protein